MINLKKLKELRDGLQELVDDGTVADHNFNMNHYRSDSDGGYEDFISKKDCGTAGCVLGWMPFIKGLEVNKEKDIFLYGGSDTNFVAYAERVLGMSYGNRIDHQYENEEMVNKWDFLFSGEWSDHDNTVDGAIARIDTFLDNPEMFKVRKEAWNHGRRKDRIQ